MTSFVASAISLPRLARMVALAGFSLTMVAAATESGRAQSVVDAFLTWQRMKCAGNVSCYANAYKIERRGVKHAVSGGEFSAIARTVIDGPNGYLMIDDEGTGGGNSVTESAIFRPAFGPALFVIATRTYETYSPRTGALAVYRWGGSTLTPAPELLPKPEPRDFVPGLDTKRATGFERSDDSWNETVFHLPRKGTTIDAYLLRFDMGLCIQDDWLGLPEAMRSASCGLAAKSYSPNMTLIFDKAQGRFRRGPLGTKRAPALR